MLRRLLVLPFVLVLLAGCSGQTPVAVSVPSTAAPTTTETPTLVPPTATNTPQPSPTETPTPTPTPTETPTPEPTATATPTTEYTKNAERQYVYRNPETGVELTAPKLTGTHQELLPITGKLAEKLPALAKEGKIIIYRAEANNPYHLKEGEVVGVFYPETYVVLDKENPKMEQQGSVGLRAEAVRYFLKKAGSPQRAAVIPLPFDVTTATAEDARFVVQFNNTPHPKTSSDYFEDIFATVPVGSYFVNPLEKKGNKPITATFSNQSWGGSVEAIGYPAIFMDNKFTLIAYYSGKKNGKTELTLGQRLFMVTSRSFSSNLISFYNNHRINKLIAHPNFAFEGKALAEDSSGNFPVLSFDEKNLIKVGNNFAFIIVNGNPIFNISEGRQSSLRPVSAESVSTIKGISVLQEKANNREQRRINDSTTKAEIVSARATINRRIS